MIISNRVAFWDGDNFVIVTKNCSKEQAKKMLQTLVALDVDGVEVIEDAAAEPIVEPEETMPVIPAETPEEQADINETAKVAIREEICFCGGRYDGMSPVEVLATYNDKGFANLAYIYQRGKVEPELLTEIRNQLCYYFKVKFQKFENPYESVATWEDKAVEQFFVLFGGILSQEDKEKILQKAGALDYDEYLKGSNIDTKKSIIAAAITKYTK